MKLRLLACLGLLLAACPAPVAAQEILDAVYPNGAPRGAEVTLTLTAKTMPDPGRLLVEGDGITPLGDVVKGSVKVRIASDATPGVRQLRVVGAKAATTPRPFVIGELPERAEKEPNDRADQADVVTSLPVVLNGTLITRAEIDVYRVTLKKGECLVVAGESRVLGAPTNLLVRVRDRALRELLVQMDYRTRDPLLGFTAPADGDYFVELQEVMNNYSNLTAAYVYRVVLTTGPWVDYGFPLGAQRGVSTAITFRGWNLGGQPGPGEVVETVEIPLEAGSPYRLTAGGAQNRVDLAAGNAPELTEEETDQSGPPSVVVPVPVVANGTFGFRGDRDTYQFAAKKGEVLLLNVNARELQSVADAVLTLKDATGKVLQTVDDGGRRGRGASRDPELLWTPPADGTYSITLNDVALGSRGGPAFYYRLSIAPPVPVLRVTGPAPTTVLKPKEKVEIPLTVQYGDLTGPVQIEAEGLPEGVTAASLTIAAAPSRSGSSEVKLVLQAGPDLKPGAAVFRIRARSGEQQTEAEAGWVLSADRSGTLAEGTTRGLVLLTPSP